uniref:Uncharacterized protein n=1 Tax=Odontella aurita TaxID=265563 RepID=A0A7S4ILY0_9STRA|mmetsp:Transcript_27064/g.79996  ORF Transcript_27064/g.79996 Transcript_27064/m.79996 type:complete len:161 (+) Transcript_27064:296-778(+)
MSGGCCGGDGVSCCLVVDGCDKCVDDCGLEQDVMCEVSEDGSNSGVVEGFSVKLFQGGVAEPHARVHEHVHSEVACVLLRWGLGGHPLVAWVGDGCIGNLEECVVFVVAVAVEGVLVVRLCATAAVVLCGAQFSCDQDPVVCALVDRCEDAGGVFGWSIV